MEGRQLEEQEERAGTLESYGTNFTAGGSFGLRPFVGTAYNSDMLTDAHVTALNTVRRDLIEPDVHVRNHGRRGRAGEP